MTTSHYFVLPKNHDLRSGGNLYNAFFLKALKAKGILVEVIDFDEYLLLRKSMKKAEVEFWVDTLYFNELKHATPLEYTNLLVHHLESLYPPDGSSEDWYEEKEQSLMQQFKGFLTTSQFTTQYLRNKGLKQPMITVLPALTSKIDQVFNPSEKANILLVANLVSRKGILPFLKTLLEQLHQAQNIEIRIVGGFSIEEEYANKCRKLVAETGLKEVVTFAGELEPEAVQKQYQWANLFVSTSYMETFGMAIQEAVGHRLPLLVLEGGNSANHVVEATNGHCFSDHHTLVTFMIGLINQPAKWNNFAQKAWNHNPFEDYSWSSAASIFIQHLKSRNHGTGSSV